MPTFETVLTPAHRPDSWSSASHTCCVRYQILAEAEPALLCQVLNLFAMQYLTPCHIGVTRENGLLAIDVQVDGLSWHRAGVIGEKMRNLIDVCSVELTHSESLQPAETFVALAAG
ncbi:hypothetical protein [Pseudomonas viridiflava]|uniref:hypothetical protein n=1 Tax=Pseudomonas viridiflava TaxID=33069 RepID=UPI000F040ACB|nr:hypothetical protein [Pseudomonas viridiflava]MEE4082124.1 hypothetical protein [Pseudomonas viridiflava]MEE4156289.1 hypothetical protein [Pseudomonas viridiflava]QXG23578.1 hypothetical protein KTT56_17410 [Pseudomonas viridiflava]